MSEEYVELYKKYRPRVWADLIGQDTVAGSLKSAIKTGRIPTAYMFSGERGTGKTSAALLVAKSLNCENPSADSEPCNSCEVCVAIDNGTQLGFNYISMANKGSAQDVREIVQQARLHQPIKRQVWILDETHNLSKQAFDSLLIPIEEGKASALFIFCSTEIEKIPETILSRIQARRFTLVKPETMGEYIDKIAQKEGLNLSSELRSAAIRMGRGSVRDTLTSLETIIETGETSTTFGSKLLEALASRNLPPVLTTLAEANSESVSFREFSEQLFEDLRDLLLVANNVDRDLIGMPPVMDEKAVIIGLGGQKGIMYYMNLVGEAITQMSNGSDSRICLEVALLKGVTAIARATAQK